MGLRNSPAVHQRHVFAALRTLIGKICHVYLDDIIIWSDSLGEHERNINLVLETLRTASLYCSLKKSSLFCTEIDFLGHHISRRGLGADPKKVKQILNWPKPKSATEVCAFLGLVRYIANFLPKLANYTRIFKLMPLTHKPCNKLFPTWEHSHQSAFENIKQLVVGRDCLVNIDHDNMGQNKIFVTCDTSNWRTGAVLSFGESWETARPVAFDSTQLCGAQLHYPTHEKELLAIIQALTKWRSDILGSPIMVYTDHQTLENFDQQKDLSRHQACWMEYMSHYDMEIVYIKGDDNTVADALSRLPNTVNSESPLPVAAMLSMETDKSLLKSIKEGYETDPFCKRLRDTAVSIEGAEWKNNLLYVGDRLVIPQVGSLREDLFHLTHDTLGHFGFNKSYAT